MGKNSLVNVRRFSLKKTIIIFIVVLVLAVAAAGLIHYFVVKATPPHLDNETSLYKVLPVERLETYECDMNAVCTVYDEKKSTNLKYCVSYEADIIAGFNVKDVSIEVDNENMKVNVIVPAVKITDVNVDISSLDYIFEKKKYNKSDVSEEAIKYCTIDAYNRTKTEGNILELAQKNAENEIESFLSPFIDQEKYELTIISADSEEEETK